MHPSGSIDLEARVPRQQLKQQEVQRRQAEPDYQLHGVSARARSNSATDLSKAVMGRHAVAHAQPGAQQASTLSVWVTGIICLLIFWLCLSALALYSLSRGLPSQDGLGREWFAGFTQGDGQAAAASSILGSPDSAHAVGGLSWRRLLWQPGAAAS